jgi:hypothetical protein
MITEFETARAAPEDDPLLHCVEERVQAVAGGFPHTFSAGELRALVAEVRKTCPLDEDQRE